MFRKIQWYGCAQKKTRPSVAKERAIGCQEENPFCLSTNKWFPRQFTVVRAPHLPKYRMTMNNFAICWTRMDIITKALGKH